jgi:hypothetical protein
MRCRILWPSAVAYFIQNWNLETALIHASDQEPFSTQHTLLLRSVNVVSGRPSINVGNCQRDMTLFPMGTVTCHSRSEFITANP